ncbi:MAG: hypothetical protein RBS01_01380 [Candidatus Dojkabacteria bacterium]|jgi:hypothetical protein|nr:hypothetical protein [Candidatus Dojkabacteria bacterium]
MNKNVKTIIKEFLIVLFVTIIPFLFISSASAWEGCCKPSTSTEYSGIYDTVTDCCYSYEDNDECCTAGDADESGCNTIIPCPSCDDDDDGDDDDDDDEVCNRCTLKECPNPPLSDNGEEIYKFKDFYSCQDSGTCTDWHYRDCFEQPSNKPTVSLTVYPNSLKTTYGFVSTTHTGAGKGDDSVNEPIRMIGRYTDSSAGEIEALYVWFSNTATMPTTPKYVDLNGDSGQAAKTASKTQYGFMMHKEGTSWKPYVPSIVGSSAGDKWVKAPYSGNQFSIKGPDGQTMVNVTILGVRTEGSSIVLEFNVSFNTVNPVQDGIYNIFMMGNDVFGFTPYDNYDAYPEVKNKIGDYWAPELIRYFDQWIDSNRDWNIDLNAPSFSNFDVSVSGKTKLEFTWDIRDNLALYGIVGNLYIDDNFKNVQPFTTTVLSGGTVNVTSPYTPHTIESSKVGHLETDYLFKILGTDGTGTASIDVGSNREGFIYLYVTGFDRGGNVTASSYLSFDLRDWMATQGGLLYSKDGIDVTSRVLEDAYLSLWNPISYIRNFDEKTSDISSELVGDLLPVDPLAPKKSTETESYMVRPYRVKDISSYYSLLKNAFERKEKSINTSQLPQGTSLLTGLLVTNSSTNIRVLDRTGNLTVGTPATPFTCNGKGIFFVSGNLTINGSILNSNANKDACIFVVRGEVIVMPGAHVSGLSQIQYDPINAYILTDKGFTINEETATFPTTDGLYVGGGIHSLEGVTLNRYLKLADRLLFPAFVVDHHSKYGIFAGELFGTQVNLQKVEVGLKP